MQLIDIFKSRTRHPFRPRSSDIVQRVFADFRDYQAEGDNLILGEGHLAERKVYVIAQQKPKPERFRSAQDVDRLNWGMLTADEHSQVLRLLRQVSENGPQEDAVLLSLVDTYGADISMESARRLQAFFIAHLIRAYINVPIRTISIVLGEGGSGGAIALQVADRRAAVEDAMYATAPPESVAAIIFRDPARIDDALAVSKSTSKHLKHFKVVDTIISQTKSVMDADGLAENIKAYLERTIKDLMRRRLDKLMAKRLETADELGVIDRGKFFEIKRFIERPLKHLYKPPAQLKIISDPSGATIHLDDTYGDGTLLDQSQAMVRCGQEDVGAKGDDDGCGAPDPPAGLS